MPAITQPAAARNLVQRVGEDRQLQEQLYGAVVHLRDAYARTAKLGVAAVEDEQLYASIRKAAGSIRGAGRALERPRGGRALPRGGRTMLLGALAGAGGGLLLMLRGRSRRPGGRP